MKSKKQYLLFTVFIFLLFSCNNNSKNLNKSEWRKISSEISNQHITSFAEDKFGQIWIGTSRGVNKFVGNQYYQYFYNQEDSLSIPDNQIRCLFLDSKKRIWIGTCSGICYQTDKDDFKRVVIDGPNINAMQICESGRGNIYINMVTHVCVYDSLANRFVLAIPNFNMNKEYYTYLCADKVGNLWGIGATHISAYKAGNYSMIYKKEFKFISSAVMDNDSQMWIVSDRRLQLFDTSTMRFVKLPEAISGNSLLMSSMIYSILNMSKTSILLYTSKGFFEYDFKQRVIKIPFDVDFLDKINSDITSMYVDSQKNLWIGTSDQSYFVKYKYKNMFNDDIHVMFALFHKSVTSLASDHDGGFWASTAHNGVFYYSRNQRIIKNVNIPFIKSQERVVKINIDAEYNLWLLTSSGLAYKCTGYNGNISLKKAYRLSIAPYNIFENADGTYFVVGYSNVLLYLKPGEDEFSKYTFDKSKFSFITSIFSYKGGLLVSAFDEDIKVIDPKTFKVKKTFPFRKYVRHSKIIPNCVTPDSRGDIWIGTIGNGLFRLHNNMISPIEGISCADISSIEEGSDGNMWISTLNGLCKYDRRTGNIVEYFVDDGIGGNQFNDRSSSVTSERMLVFGGTHGVTYFNPRYSSKHRKIDVLFESLKIYDEDIRPDQDKCIKQSLNYNPDIYLNYKQRSFSISFAALDYGEFSNVQYYYKIEGYDKYWIKSGSDHVAIYSNLPSGNYIFKVKITSNDVNNVIGSKSIRIHVIRAPWLQWWAITIYVLLVSLTAAYVINISKRIRIQKEIAKREKREKEAEWETNQMNMRFFSNVSHEFRTPLTMILGPISSLSNDKRITGDQKHLLSIVQRSVDRMLKLVNRLLQFQKLESDVIRVEVSYGDIVRRINDVIAIFKINAEEKGIELSTVGLEDKYDVWFDGDKVETIISNFLSNAMKFTPSGGEIIVSFDVESNQMKISVSDTGPGIPEDKKKDIFKRYYQIENSQTILNWGTGIGLYYSQRLAEIHHGRISVDNNSDGGAVFTLILPINGNEYLDCEKAVSAPLKQSMHIEEKDLEQNEEDAEGINAATVLVVDDDVDIANYMKDFLSSTYKIEVRFNAKSAYMSLDEINPDIIISDVLMPDVDGFQFCRMIKQNISYSHIPVILLTAKTLVDDQIRGLHDGANAYVTKPFDPQYLLALIQSLLRNQENLRHALEHSTKAEGIDTNIISGSDSSFMRELYSLMDKGLSDSELNINRIIEGLHISRTKFYYKMKGLTGMSPNEFFKAYKLNRAAELINEGKHNISEIADITGFSTLSHFSVSFKKYFGVPPSDYKQ